MSPTKLSDTRLELRFRVPPLRLSVRPPSVLPPSPPPPPPSGSHSPCESVPPRPSPPSPPLGVGDGVGVDIRHVVNRIPLLVLLVHLLQPNVVFLRVRRHLGRGPGDDKVTTNTSPIPFPEF